MLGYTQENNDVCIFYEKDEVNRLPHEKISGIYFNLRDLSIIGCLESCVDEGINDLIKTETEKDEKGFVKHMNVKINPREYEKLVEKGECELHQGFRHVFLGDVNRLDFVGKLRYMQLKKWEDEINKNGN